MYDPYPLDYPIKKELIGYSTDVIDGKIIACQKHKWACMRFLRDLEREGTEGFPFLFNEEKALRFLNWMKLYKHRKGVLVGQRIDPHIIQKFVFGNIYGWEHKDTRHRRFRKGYWQVAKKNAKSQSLSCVASYELMAMGAGKSEVYCAATKTDQAKIVLEETEAMLDNCEELKGKYKVAYSRIIHKKTGSVMRALSKEDKKTGDGLDPQCGIIDEYMASETSEIHDVIESAMVARAEPLLMIITTAGLDLNVPCYEEEYMYMSSILDPNNPIENDGYFGMINELDKDEEGNLIDDINDERIWEKANPIICSYPEGIKNLKDLLIAAQDVPEKMRSFLTKNMNIWVNEKRQGYMNMAKWALCGATEKNPFPDVTGLPVISGVDLSSTIDLTSVSFEIQLPDSRIAVMSHSFMPADKFHEKMKSDKRHYDLWEKQKWLTVTPGAVVDYNFVLKYIENTYEKYNWVKGEVCFDRALATWLMVQLENRGFTPVDIPQGMLTLSEPTKDFRTQVYSQNKNIIHDNNPVLTWAISNAVTRKDHNENIMLDKSKSRERIDPIASLINAHVRAISKFKILEEDIFYSPDI